MILELLKKLPWYFLLFTVALLTIWVLKWWHSEEASFSNSWASAFGVTLGLAIVDWMRQRKKTSRLKV